MGADAGFATSDVIKALLHDQDPSVRWRAAEVLLATKEYTSAVKSALKTALHDERYYVRWHARIALRQIISSDELETTLLATTQSEIAAVRRDAIAELSLITYKSDLSLASLTHFLNQDSDAEVRLSAGLGLQKYPHLGPAQFDALNKALNDRETSVRLHAALNLIRFCVVPKRLVPILLDGLQSRLLAAHAVAGILEISRDPRTRRQWLASSVTIPHQLIGEVLARGVLPTIGLKKWHKSMPIEIPTKGGPQHESFPYAWEDEGVFHCWLSHSIWASANYPVTNHQVCFFSDWFPKIHLIALGQLISFDENQKCLSFGLAKIEGREIGYIAQGGGIITELSGMRPLPTDRTTNRIDFLHGFKKDARALQFLVFAGQSAQKSADARTRLETKAANIWIEFCEYCQTLFRKAGLDELFLTDWSRAKPIPSMRYGLRFDREYDEIQFYVARLAEHLAIPRSTFARKMKKLIDSTTARLENDLIEYGLDNSDVDLASLFGADIKNGRIIRKASTSGG